MRSLAELRKTLPAQIAAELVSVQPMPADIMQKLFAEGKDETWLVANGYEPVSSDTKLIWTKK